MPDSQDTRPAARSWRGMGIKQRKAERPRYIARSIWTMLLVGLAGYFAYEIWIFMTTHNARLACLVAAPTSPLVAGPLRYCDEDRMAFCGLAPGNELTVYKKDRDRSDLIPHLFEDIGAPGRDECLVLYVVAHGVTDPEGKAWLICGDYTGYSGDPAKGRYALHDLLEQAAAAPAARKLLVLDTSHDMTDPRAGMLANRFPEILEEEVFQMPPQKRQDLWVLSSSGPFQIEHYSERDHRSVFGYFFTEGLRGDADGYLNGQRPDGNVDLDELYYFVHDNVAEWVKNQSKGSENQAPLLLHAGTAGPVLPPAGYHVRSAVKKRVVKTAKTADEGPQENTPEVPKLDKEIDTVLEKVWDERDALADRKKDGWALIDYAPHLWRDYQDLLVEYEWKARTGGSFAEAAQKGLGDIAGRLEGLVSGNPLAGKSKTDVVSRVYEARRQFEENKVRLDRVADACGIRKALQERNDALFVASYGVRWHAAALRLDSQHDNPFLADREQGLFKLIEALGPLCNELDSAVQSGKLTNPLRLAELVKQVGDLRNRLQNSWENEARGTGAAEPSAAEADLLLTTPLLPKPLRWQLLKNRRRHDALFILNKESKTPERSGGLRSPPLLLARAKTHRELEVRLASLLAPGDVGLTSLLAAGSQKFNDDKDTGNAVRSFYQSFSTIHGDLFASDNRLRFAAARKLLLANARDVESPDYFAVDMLLPRDENSIVVRPRLVDLDSSRLILQPSVPAPPRKLTISVASSKIDEAELRLDCDNRPLAEGLVLRGKDKQWKCGEPIRVPLVGGTGSLSLEIEYRRPPPQPGKTVPALAGTLKVGVTAGGLRAEPAGIPVRVPGPTRIELAASLDLGRSSKPCSVKGACITLRPFPNRKSTFILTAANRSEFEKDLTAALVVFPGQFEPAWREALFNSRGELASNVTRLTPDLPLKLKPGEEKPIPFPEPPKPDSASPAKEPPPAPDVTEGFICLVRDKADKTAWWASQVRFVPYMPDNYLKPKFEYDENNDELQFTLANHDRDVFPPDTAAHPVVVKWANAPRGWAVTEGQSIDPRSPTTQFTAKVPPPLRNNPLPIWLDVDGCPRALQYGGRPDDPQNYEPDATLDDVTITAPEDGTAYSAAKLPVTIPLGFEVNAPRDAFDEAHDDKIIVRILDDKGLHDVTNGEGQTFTTARKRKISLLETHANGELKVQTTIGDYKDVPLIMSRRHQKVQIAVDLVLAPRANGVETPHKRKTVTVVLDDVKPKITALSVPAELPKGQPLTVTADVESFSNVQKVEIGLEDPEKPNNFAGQPAKQIAQASGNTWSAAFEKLDLGGHVVLVKATNVVGETSETKALTVVPPPAPPPTAVAANQPPPVVKLTVKGQVIIGGVTPASGTVYLDGKTAELKDGAYEFSDVPAGDHKIHAKAQKGAFKGKSEPETIPCPADGPSVVTKDIEVPAQ